MAELDSAIGQWTAKHSVEKVLQVLDEAKVPGGKIYTVADIACDPHYQARDMIEKITMNDGSFLSVPGLVPKLSRTPGAHRRNAPDLGQDSNQVLSELGITAEQIQAMRERGIIR